MYICGNANLDSAYTEISHISRAYSAWAAGLRPGRELMNTSSAAVSVGRPRLLGLDLLISSRWI